MAVVYKAFDTRLESEVAIKFIRIGEFPSNALPRILKRFRIEAQKMAQLQHPNIVKVMDYGEFDGVPYLVMGYLQGGSLKAHMGKPMPCDKAARLLLPVADALEYAHSKGLIHRDIKPSNILITESGQPMLSDFGVAKVLESEETLDLTMTGMGVGTPEYMAPEIGLQKDFDHRADIYSLGVMFYELVTGRKPFIADTPMAVMFKHFSDPLPRPSQFVANIPEEVERVLFKMLAKDPHERYQDMREVSLALEKLTGLPADDSWVIDDQRMDKDTKFPSEGKPLQQDVSRVIPETSDAINAVETPSKKNEPFKSNLLLGAMGVVGLGLIIFAGIKIFSGSDDREAIVQENETPQAVETTELIPINTPSPISALGIGSTMVSETDGMTLVYVPGGEFEMGVEDGDSDERPVHTVYLDAFWIDQTEVTNAQYGACVQSGACGQPLETEYFDDNNYSDHPVVTVDWGNAQDYCQWAGRRLPTEAEWEKAARGENGFIYPWGNTFDSSLANLDDETNIDDYTIDCTSNGCDGYDRTAPAGSFPGGASPYGAYDLAGNVWEWTADWYADDYYQASPSSNPTGPDSGIDRVLRGGSWYNSEWNARSAFRKSPQSLLHVLLHLGFRCARSP